MEVKFKLFAVTFLFGIISMKKLFSDPMNI